MKIIERVVQSDGAPGKNDLWLDHKTGSPELKEYYNGEWVPVGGNGGSDGSGSGSGCDCPYKAGTPVLIDQLPENPDEPDFELTKAELAAAFGITEQDVDSIFELARPYIGVYNNMTKRNNMFSLNSCGYDNGVVYVVYYWKSTEVTFVSLSGSYTYYIDQQDA